MRTIYKDIVVISSCISIYKTSDPFLLINPYLVLLSFDAIMSDDGDCDPLVENKTGNVMHNVVQSHTNAIKEIVKYH